jgi:hypothetical protein
MKNDALRYFFIIGGQKTGTTLLARLLDGQPKISCIWESYALNPLHDTSILNLESHNRVLHGFEYAFISELRTYWKLGTIDYFADAHHRYSAFGKTMGPLLADFAARNDSVFVGDKWPWYIRHLDALLTLFPEAKLIHLVRDPRAIWNSAQRFLVRERGDVVLWEILDFEKRLDEYMMDSDRLIRVKYEDLIRNPVHTVSNILKFIGNSTVDGGIARYFDSNISDERWSWVPEANKPIALFHADKWKTQMTASQIDSVTRTSQSFLEKYNYEY